MKLLDNDCLHKSTPIKKSGQQAIEQQAIVVDGNESKSRAKVGLFGQGSSLRESVSQKVSVNAS